MVSWTHYLRDSTLSYSFVPILQEAHDSQLYQAFLFRYATECYRRKKYNPIHGIRIWAYGEVTPGIRFHFLDYYRVPKMAYYALKEAQERLAIHFAYEEPVEVQSP